MAIDIVTSIQRVEFDTAFKNVNVVKIQNIEVELLNISDLIATKRATGRYKVLENLESKRK